MENTGDSILISTAFLRRNRVREEFFLILAPWPVLLLKESSRSKEQIMYFQNEHLLNPPIRRAAYIHK